MSFLVETPADAARRRGLRQMRIVATALLVLAGVVWIATIRLDQSGVWGYVNFAAKAAMVGALADWFAVTALFKHPMGLKIPHTAIIKRKKDQLGTSLGSFVGQNFLAVDVVSQKVESARIPLRLTDFGGVLRGLFKGDRDMRLLLDRLCTLGARA